MREALQIAVAVVAAVFAIAATPDEVRNASIRFVGKAYHYTFAVDVAAPIEAVRDVVTDYDHLRRINDDVVESIVLERYADGRLKRRLWINHCLLVFCFDLYFVEHVETLADGAIRTTVIPAESNFRSGVSVWRIEAIDDEATRVSVDAEQEPDFWIPPVIGPLMFKRAFMKEVRETAVNIEREALRVTAQ